MLKVITGRSEVLLFQRKFNSRLKNLLKPKGVYTIGYESGNFEDDVHSNGEIWFATGKLLKRKNPCHWNCFGTELRQRRSNNIVVEINIPISGISRALSGLFAKDLATGDIFLLHRGRVGGGRKG